MLLNISQYIPQKLKISFDYCNRKQGIATLGVGTQSGSSSFLGALAVISSNSFENYTLVDLSRSPDNSRINSNSVCVNLSSAECSSIQVIDSIIINSHLFTLTTKGLYSSSSTTVETNQTLPASFTKIFPLAGDNSFINYTRIFGKSDCFNSDQNFVYVSYLDTYSKLLYSKVDDLISTSGLSWESISILSIDGVANSAVFFSAARDNINQRNIYLIGNPLYGSDQITCSGNSSCLIDQGSIIIDSGNGLIVNAFTFPSNLKIAGMEFQSKTNDIYLFGSEVSFLKIILKVWTSSDGGYTFSQLHSELFADDEYFVEFDSGIFNDAYIMRTNMNRIFHGRINSANILEIRSITSHEDEHMVISADNTGAFWTFSIPGNYSGFVSSSGSILLASSEFPFMVKRRIPMQFEIDNVDEFSGLTLIPIWNSEQSLQFYVNGTNSITKDLSGYKIKHDNGGEFSISHLSEDGKILYGTIKSPMVPESSAKSPATSGSLSVSGIINQRDVVQQDYPSQPLNEVVLIVSSIASYGWLLSDIGKTVVFHSGSILIAEITNSTHARGILIFPPEDSTDAASGMWSIYDFRSYYEFPSDPSQSLNIISNSTGTYGYPAPSLGSSYGMHYL
jgi:hypothetical protein